MMRIEIRPIQLSTPPPPRQNNAYQVPRCTALFHAKFLTDDIELLSYVLTRYVPQPRTYARTSVRVMCMYVLRAREIRANTPPPPPSPVDIGNRREATAAHKVQTSKKNKNNEHTTPV